MPSSSELRSATAFRPPMRAPAPIIEASTAPREPRSELRSATAFRPASSGSFHLRGVQRRALSEPGESFTGSRNFEAPVQVVAVLL